MTNVDYSDPQLELIIAEEGNFQYTINPKWASIQNGVFICGKCARKHRLFSKNISYVKSIEADIWTKREISFLRKGGNKRFNQYMYDYNIPVTIDNQKFKYYTKIIDYYRKVLESEVNGEECLLIKPNLKEGIELIDEGYINNIPLCEPKVIKKKIENKENEINNQSENDQQNQETNLGEEINNVACSLGKIFEQIGSNISKRVKDNTLIQAVKTRAGNGIEYIQEKASGLLEHHNN